MIDISGFARLRKDPKSEPINMTNILFRHEILHKTEWVLALVIEIGNNCKVYDTLKDIDLKDTGYSHT